MHNTLYDDGTLYDLAFGDRADDAQLAFYRRLAEAHGGDCLELGCGTGRITVPLAEAGVRMAGVDASPPMLDVARRKGAGLPIDWVEADFRDFHLGRRFGLVVFPMNTIAHLPTREDFEAAMARVREHLAPDGRFAIEYFLPSLALLGRNPELESPVAEVRDEAGALKIAITESNRYDPIAQVNHILWFCRLGDGRVREQSFAMRIFFPQELATLLHHSGFEVEARFGDFEGAPLGPTSRKQILVCRHAAN
jgi:SAM-dependent methyltransferase